MDRVQTLKISITERMQEAEGLAMIIELIEEEQARIPCMYRWAIVADEVQRLLQLAEETLSERQVDILRQQIGVERWNKYRYSERRFKAITGKEIWEHFDNEPD